MECRIIVKSVCPRAHRLSGPCFRKNSICRKCEAEDREKERKKQRDHQLDIERESRQKDYAKKLQELQDEIAHERQILKDREEQNEQENTLRQHRQDLENVKRLKTQSHREPGTHNLSNPDGSTRTVSTENRSNKTSGLPNETPAVESTDSDRQESGAGEEWANQKQFENAQNEAIDSLMDMIGLEDVKSKFLSIKSKVDTAVRQNIGLKGERFGAALLGNPGTGTADPLPKYVRMLTSSRQDNCRSTICKILDISRRSTWQLLR